MAGSRVSVGEVRAIGRGGDAIVETSEGIVLVPGALPGEHIELERTPSKRGAARGRLRRVLRPSRARVEPPCVHASRCGGCPLMIADPEMQKQIKLELLRDACRALPGSEESELQWVASPDAFGYRRRARLAWHGSTLGYRALRSSHVNDIDACMVLMPLLATAWTATRTRLAGALQGSGEIQLQLGRDGRVAVALTSSDDQTPDAFDACAALSREDAIAGVSLGTEGGGAPATWGQEHVVLFSQANDGINQALVRTVAELAEPGGLRVLELHSGVGNFTVELAARAPSSLVAVEQEPRAVEACRAALERRGFRARVTVGDANHPPKGRYDVVVLDPPRQGARALFEESDLFPGPKRIVYVSCDTATLGRDLRIATSKGYRIDRTIGFDMFPQTAHLESLVRLVRA
jgi:23S rRNA (uracil1939-C5)-methyltransferase